MDIKHNERYFRLNKLSTFYISFLLTFLCIISLQLTGNYLKNEIAPLGILSFEFAYDLTKANAIVASWDSETKVYAGLNLGIDYLFLFLYSLTIALGCILSSNFAKKPISGFVKGVTYLQIIAALLDAVENYALIKLLLGAQQSHWPSIAYWCALPKFAIVLVGIGTILIFIIIGLLKQIR